MGKSSKSSKSKPSAEPESSTKADRKFEKKLQFYAKVRDTVASLTAKKAIKKKKLRSRQKKLKAYDLSSLSEFLPELKAPRQPNPTAEFKVNCKSRKKLILKEWKQLSTVLNHPAFQAEPLAAIRQHIESTQPVSDEKQKKKINKNGSKKKKGKTSTGHQSLDI
ncbi:Ribosome biogenesis protein [Melia azedarach]|uniref:Ribosome biogenesis protein n=1 Tax=Melia azedarach TaxID=155640 RepID=A0ACC1XZY1_MELAZ|nr:Ribosome biogenesis protein [Melia azedarach]